MGNLWSADYSAARAYEHSGFSTTILTTLTLPFTTPRGMSYDGANLWFTNNSQTIYKMVGKTSTIDSSYTEGVSYGGCSHDGVNVIVTAPGVTSDALLRYDGWLPPAAPNQYLDNIASPSTDPYGCTWDGLDLYSADFHTRYAYQHDEFSTTILDYLDLLAIAQNLFDITWDGDNLIVTDNRSSGDRFIKFVGFSTTIDTTITTPATNPTGVTWDDFIARTSNAPSTGGVESYFAFID